MAQTADGLPPPVALGSLAPRSSHGASAAAAEMAHRRHRHREGSPSALTLLKQQQVRGRRPTATYEALVRFFAGQALSAERSLPPLAPGCAAVGGSGAPPAQACRQRGIDEVRRRGSTRSTRSKVTALRRVWIRGIFWFCPCLDRLDQGQSNTESCLNVPLSGSSRGGFGSEMVPSILPNQAPDNLWVVKW